MITHWHNVCVPNSKLQVRVIRSCSQSINKVVELLQQKFPTISKSVLRNKVREISDFVDNRWQVTCNCSFFAFRVGHRTVKPMSMSRNNTLLNIET